MEYNIIKIENRIKRNKKIKKIIGISIMIIIVLLFLINLLLGYYDYVEKNNKIINNKIYIFTIVSESMEPILKPNDLIIVEKEEENNIYENDIITYKVDGKIISHRVIRKEKKGNETFFITKGDNNQLEDENEIKIENIYGKLKTSIPNLGKIVRFIQKENGMIISISLIILFFLINNIREKKKLDRKNKRKKYEIKEKREKYKI